MPSCWYIEVANAEPNFSLTELRLLNWDLNNKLKLGVFFTLRMI